MESNKAKKAWLPKSKQGKRALIFLVIIIFLIGLTPAIMEASDIRIFRIIGSLSASLSVVVLSIMGFLYSRKAIYKLKDRAILLYIALILYCFLCASILFFIIAEFSFPH